MVLSKVLQNCRPLKFASIWTGRAPVAAHFFAARAPRSTTLSTLHTSKYGCAGIFVVQILLCSDTRVCLCLDTLNTLYSIWPRICRGPPGERMFLQYEDILDIRRRTAGSVVASPQQRGIRRTDSDADGTKKFLNDEKD